MSPAQIIIPHNCAHLTLYVWKLKKVLHNFSSSKQTQQITIFSSHHQVISVSDVTFTKASVQHISDRRITCHISPRRQYTMQTPMWSITLQNFYFILLPARRRPQRLVVIGVCLSVCLCALFCLQDISRTGSWITTKFGGWEQGVNL